MAKKKSWYHSQKANVILKEFHLLLSMLRNCPTPVRNFGTNGGRFIEILLYKEKMEMAKSGIRRKHKLKSYRISFSHFNLYCTCTCTLSCKHTNYPSVELESGEWKV